MGASYREGVGRIACRSASTGAPVTVYAYRWRTWDDAIKTYAIGPVEYRTEQEEAVVKLANGRFHLPTPGLSVELIPEATEEQKTP